MWPEPSLAPLLWLIAATLVLTGLIGVVLPVVPGAVLVYLGLLLAAWIDGFARVGPLTIVILTAATALVYVIDIVAGSFGAKHLGASRRAVWGAAIGTVVGLFFGLPGILIGPFLGAVAGEYTAHRQLARAGKAGAGTWLGLALGAAAKVALVFGMLALFTIAYVL
jgi:uncharacterized protein YqgC (DUF456 family)